MIKKCLNCDSDFIDPCRFNNTKFCKECKPIIKYMVYKLWRREHINRYLQYGRTNYLNHPYLKTYNGIQTRCLNKNAYNFNYYGGRGILNFLKIKDLKFLWERDNAELMVRPEIHRKNNDKHYTLENCEYVEHKEHRILHYIGRK